MKKALVLVALALLAAPMAAGAAGSSARLIASAEETVLRLHDLPPGYSISGDSDCDAIPRIQIKKYRALDRWIGDVRPRVCRFVYERRFEVPGLEPEPAQVKGEVIATPSKAAATRGWRVFRRLIARVPSLEARGSTPIGSAGPSALLLRRKGRAAGTETASMLLWRDGKLLALVEAGGLDPEENDAAALHYAQIQQGRLEAPSPYTEAERDDTEVELDDPNLTVPVYWLGRDFAAGDLGSTELQTATAARWQLPPGVELELRYDGFDLKTWTEQSWKRFQATFFRKINHPPCTRTTSYEWKQGHAVISAGYRRRTFEHGCPHFPPTRYWAAAHIGGVVVGVNQTTCMCLSPGSGPYSESLRGMKAILRGLVLRPKPVY
jgi:hypothetical protein